LQQHGYRFAIMNRLPFWFGRSVAFALLATGVAAAQAYSPPRTTGGKPDLSGVWTNTTDLPVERPDGVAALAISQEAYEANKAGGARIDVQTVNGELRTSLVVDPPDGKLPFRNRASAMAWREKYGVFVTGGPMPEFTLGPDTMPNRDRCLMAANSAAPPMGSQGDNDVHQIVQTPGFIVLYAEIMNETRIVPVFASAAEATKRHRPSALPRWTGDSVGWWEGDTFVMETVNVDIQQGAQSPMPISRDARVVERFTRISDSELLYRAEVTDPALYTRAWKTESSFRPATRIWEYACHEGNYGMAGILSGARKTERDAVSK
jgi:hypothetical protein